MAIIGLSLIFASLVFVFVRPQPWLGDLLEWLRRPRGAVAPAPAPAPKPRPPLDGGGGRASGEPPTPGSREGQVGGGGVVIVVEQEKAETGEDQLAQDRKAMPPPPPLSSGRRPPPDSREGGEIGGGPLISVGQEEEMDTNEDQEARDRKAMPPPPPPRLNVPPQGTAATGSPTSIFLGPGSAQRARGPASVPSSSSSSSPLPNRAGARASLAPPPTHSAPPTPLKSSSSPSSRQVILAPGCSPLDWARLSADPCADLRGLGPDAGSGLLRIGPAALRRMTGRRGHDAWMAIGGRVYNVSPYLRFHPGGVPELLRGAGRDGTQLFGEVHPWVNYETMLAGCLVGILVGDGDGDGTRMDEMD